MLLCELFVVGVRIAAIDQNQRNLYRVFEGPMRHWGMPRRCITMANQNVRPLALDHYRLKQVGRLQLIMQIWCQDFSAKANARLSFISLVLRRLKRHGLAEAYYQESHSAMVSEDEKTTKQNLSNGVRTLS